MQMQALITRNFTYETYRIKMRKWERHWGIKAEWQNHTMSSIFSKIFNSKTEIVLGLEEDQLLKALAGNLSIEGHWRSNESGK